MALDSVAGSQLLLLYELESEIHHCALRGDSHRVPGGVVVVSGNPSSRASATRVPELNRGLGDSLLFQRLQSVESGPPKPTRSIRDSRFILENPPGVATWNLLHYVPNDELYHRCLSWGG